MVPSGLMGKEIFSALLSMVEVLEKLIFWSCCITYIFGHKLFLVFGLPMTFALTLPTRIFWLMSVVWLNFPVKQIGTFKLLPFFTRS